MPALTARDILRVWDLGQSQGPVDRALTLCAFAQPEMSHEALASLSIGQRDSRLLALREQTFGSSLNGFSRCPQCEEPLEIAFAASDFQVAGAPEGVAQAWELAVGDVTLSYRLPTSADLAAVAAEGGRESAYALLVERCLLEASRSGTPLASGALPAEALGALAADMAERDPQAEILLSLTCPGCGHRWQELFDIASFFWVELAAEAQRLMEEVHALAAAYGWRETDILAMSSRRREWYLQLVGTGA